MAACKSLGNLFSKILPPPPPPAMARPLWPGAVLLLLAVFAASGPRPAAAMYDGGAVIMLDEKTFDSRVQNSPDVWLVRPG